VFKRDAVIPRAKAAPSFPNGTSGGAGGSASGAVPAANPGTLHDGQDAADGREVVVSVRDLTYRYPDGTLVDYGDTPLELRAGERIVLLGPNGSGKSTLLLHVLGLLEPLAGEVRVFDAPPQRLPAGQRVQVAALLQQVDEQLLGPTVWDDVAFAPRNLGLSEADTTHLVEAALTRLGIWELRQKVVHALSIGEKRKVALAGAIVFSEGSAFGPRLLVLDEPFAALDPRSRRELVDLLDELRGRHQTAVLVSTHFVHTVPDFADRVIMLAPGGRIAATGNPREVFARPEVLEALDIEPPVLSQLFRSLERRGITLPAPLSVDHAADLLAVHCRAGGRRLPDAGRGRQP
jgi:cobalt/nickel transport system ATP-binding protein